MSFAIEHLWRCWLWRPIMIFPSCYSPALISSCLLAPKKIRTQKTNAALCDPGKRKFTKTLPC
jgi:hypothetical protein